MEDFQRPRVFAQREIEDKNSLRYQVLRRAQLSKKQIKRKTITWCLLIALVKYKTVLFQEPEYHRFASGSQKATTALWLSGEKQTN